MEVQLTITNLADDSAMIDLLENQSISLSWRFSDIQELAILGSYTKQFRIPASDRNVALFGPLFNVNLVSGNFSYHKKCIMLFINRAIIPYAIDVAH